MRKIIPLALAITLLGCDGSESSTSDITPSVINMNGIFMSENEDVMWASSYDGDDYPIVVFDTAITHFYDYNINNTTVTGLGLYRWNTEPTTYLPDATIPFEYHIENQEVSTIGLIGDESFTHTFKKQPASLTLEDLAGIHPTYDELGEWTINTDGSFSLISSLDCQFEGTLTARGEGYTADYTASGCDNEELNGPIKGIGFTVTYDDGPLLVIYSKTEQRYLLMHAVPIGTSEVSSYSAEMKKSRKNIKDAITKLTVQ